MKFSELDIGDEFSDSCINALFMKTREMIDRKVENINAVSFFAGSVNFAWFADFAEVEKINTKSCEKCKAYNEEKNRCMKIQVEISKCCQFKKPETFYCSEFERKEN